MNKKHYPNLQILLGILALFTIFTTTSCKKTPGCTDPNSITYNPEAKEDDGSCVYPEMKKRPLLVEFTAVWCPPCGSWGYDAMKQMVADFGDDVIPIASHGSFSQPDTMTNDYSHGFYENMPITGWPNFYVGSTALGTKTSDAQKAYESESTEPLIANAAALYTIDGNDIDVSAVVEFFENATGNYTLAIYVLEDKINGDNTARPAYDQKGNDEPGYTHDHVLRAGAVNNVFGESIGSTSISAGETFQKEYSIDILDYWDPENLHVIAVIWKDEGGTWVDINAANAVERELAEED